MRLTLKGSILVAPNKGVMSYGSASDKGQWSSCSVKDFKGLYNSRINENNGEWCLTPQGK